MILVPADNEKVRRRWSHVTVGQKEPETLDFVRSDLDDQSVFFDIGANVGNYCVLAAVAHPRARVIAFEPEPSNFLSLCRLIYLNQLPITPYPFAIGASCGVDVFNLKGSFEAGLANHQLGRDVDQDGQAFEPVFSVGMAAFSVDALVHDHGLPAPTHVKIDVDGLEVDVLRGMKRTLAGGTVRGILTEVSSDQVRVQIEDFLAEFGYRLAKAGDSSRKIYRLVFTRDGAASAARA